MKTLLSLVAVAIMSFSALAGGGDNDSPYNLPKFQFIQSGELGIVATMNPQTVTLTTAGAMATMTPGGRRPIVTETGIPGGDLVTEWQEQDGTAHKVVTKKGAGEKPKDFVKRHKETVKLMKDAFPPCRPTTG